jgi:para-aminobenzoate synthetase component 1
LALLESCTGSATAGRYSIVAANPQLIFRSYGARCEILRGAAFEVVYGNPWRVIESLMARFDLAESDDALPAGAAIGYWGYEMRQFVEPKLRPHLAGDLPLPDCWLGFYDSLVIFDHVNGDVRIVSTGLDAEGCFSETRAQIQLDNWRRELDRKPPLPNGLAEVDCDAFERVCETNLDREAYLSRVRQALAYIRSGDIYQVNLARRWTCHEPFDAWQYYQALARESPAPFAAFLEGEDFALASSSPEQFLQFEGAHVQTRPIKGTRPRSVDMEQDQRWASELAASPKEQAELTMITDLLRNDLGKVSEFGSVCVPALAQLERFAQVQHLVSTVRGRLRPEVSQVAALEACFPGGSVTGAPKFRAMQVIDELEPAARGPYTGCLGYLGFNRRSQLSVIIRSLFAAPGAAWIYAGSGIVADSDPEAEHVETLVKGRVLREVLDKVVASAGTMRARGASRLAA